MASLSFSCFSFLACYSGCALYIRMSKLSSATTMTTKTNTYCWDNEDDDDDPGLIFKLVEPAQVHTCMAIPSVASVRPPLQQGKKKTFVAFCYFLHFCRDYS